MNLYKIFKNSFLTFNCLVSKPILKLTAKKLTILLFFFDANMKNNNKTKKIATQEDNLFFLSTNLSKQLNIPVDLDLIKLHNYNLEGHILGQAIGIITDKLGRNLRSFINKVFNNTNIINPDKIKNKKHIGNKAISNFTGMNIKLGGRLSRQATIPRKTVSIFQRGNLTRRHSNFLTVAKFTAKNRKGIFCYTITIGHKCY